MIKNDLILKAIRGEQVERTPIWIMRQAGRVLPEYREVRAKMGGFKELVASPEFACEVTVQPVDILGVDAAIIFSDILVIPAAMGLDYQMVESKGPWFEKTVGTKSDIEALRIAEADDLQYVMDAIVKTKSALNNRVPLIGFAGAPWTILAYMIEGSGSKTFAKAKKFLYTQPKLAHQLLEKISLSTINYLKGQAVSGADLVQLFDSWAGILSPEQFKEFSLKYISMICNEIDEVPVTVFAKDAHYALKDLSNVNCETIGLDWTIDPLKARSEVGSNKTLQGNMDPCVLYADDEMIVAETEKMLKAFGPNRHIANLGHGLYPDLEKEKVKLFVETVKNFKHSDKRA